MMDRSGVASTAINDQMPARGGEIARWIIISYAGAKKKGSGQAPFFCQYHG